MKKFVNKLRRIIQLSRSQVIFRVDYKLPYIQTLTFYTFLDTISIAKQTLIGLLITTQTHSSYF